MVRYKWSLRAGSIKETCPACGQRRFVPYVATADGKTLAGAEFGRCDREENCGYHRYPNGKSTEGIEPMPQKLVRPLRFHTCSVRTEYSGALFEYACNFVGYANAVRAWYEYKVGAQGNRAIFWQISKAGEIRAGKSIPYKKDGHRDKDDKFPASWLHRLPEWRGCYLGETLQQCFFGEHRLNGNACPVAIVESEKTALLMSMFSRGFVWLACGGSNGLKNEEKNKVLAGRDVIIVPDNGQYWNWKAIADTNSWRIVDQIEKHPCFAGCDILDMVEAGCFGIDLLKYKLLYEN